RPPAPVAAPIPPPAAPQPPVQLTPEQQREQADRQRIQRDPFGFQADSLKAQEQQFIDALAQQEYQIAPEEMDAFLSGDGATVSRALARVHVNAVGSVLRVVAQQLPMYMNNMMQRHQQTSSREDQFWKANPHLNKAQHYQLAMSTAKAYIQMNPGAA